LDLRILKGLADFAEYFSGYHTMWLSFVKAFFKKSAGVVDRRRPPEDRSYGCA